MWPMWSVKGSDVFEISAGCAREALKAVFPRLEAELAAEAERLFRFFLDFSWDDLVGMFEQGSCSRLWEEVKRQRPDNRINIGVIESCHSSSSALRITNESRSIGIIEDMDSHAVLETGKIYRALHGWVLIHSNANGTAFIFHIFPSTPWWIRTLAEAEKIPVSILRSLIVDFTARLERSGKGALHFFEELLDLALRIFSSITPRDEARTVISRITTWEEFPWAENPGTWMGAVVLTACRSLGIDPPGRLANTECWYRATGAVRSSRIVYIPGSVLRRVCSILTERGILDPAVTVVL